MKQLYALVISLLLCSCTRYSEADSKLFVRPATGGLPTNIATFESEITSPQFCKQVLQLNPKLEAEVSRADVRFFRNSSIVTISVSASTSNAAVAANDALLTAVKLAAERSSNGFQASVIQSPVAK
jgi:hypothetical protein